MADWVARASARPRVGLPAAAAVAGRGAGRHPRDHRRLAARPRRASSAARWAASTRRSSRERCGCRAVLVNPAVDPARDLAAHIGRQTMYHAAGESFDFRAEYVDELRAMTPPTPLAQPERHPRDHRQGRRGARLARDDGALRARPAEADRRQRPRAVGLRVARAGPAAPPAALNPSASARRSAAPRDVGVTSITFPTHPFRGA